MIQSALIILAVALVGGFLPVLLRRSERQLHTALALSTGIFLGAVFLHLLPSLAAFDQEMARVHAEHEHAEHEHASGAEGAHEHAGESDVEDEPAADAHAAGDHDADEHAGHDHAEGETCEADADSSASLTDEELATIGLEELHHQSGHAHGNTLIWFCVLLGVLSVYLVEALLLRTHDHGDLHRHRSVGIATLLGISVHALTAGFSLGALGGTPELHGVLLVAVLGHKGFEAFSLATVFQLAEFSTKAVIGMVIGFGLVTPVGMLVGDAVAHMLGSTGLAVLTALASGTFLFVCLSELLPEVFHHREDTFSKLLLLAVGIGLMVLFEQVGI